MIGNLLIADRIFVVLLAVAALPFVFLHNPTGAPYLQPAVPYVLLSCAALCPFAQTAMERRQAGAFVAIAVVVVALQVGRLTVQAAQHLNRPLWTTGEVRDLSERIARHVSGGPVATLYPTLVLDAGNSIYPEFATGVYFFRSGNYLAPERVLELNAASPRTLPALFGARPPAAIFVGNTDVDRPLMNWAQRNCYVEADMRSWQGGPYHDEIWKPRLFVRPPEPDLCRPDKNGALPKPAS
jgi:hypothetical protein